MHGEWKEGRLAAKMEEDLPQGQGSELSIFQKGYWATVIQNKKKKSHVKSKKQVSVVFHDKFCSAEKAYHTSIYYEINSQCGWKSHLQDSCNISDKQGERWIILQKEMTVFLKI